MQCELSVALQLKVLHHFIERLPSGSARRLEDPGAIGTPKTPKTFLFNPYQLPIHGPPCRCAPALSDRMPNTRFAVEGLSVLHTRGVQPDCRRKPSPGLGVAKDT